jgi:hypothetical protein
LDTKNEEGGGNSSPMNFHERSDLKCHQNSVPITERSARRLVAFMPM